MLSLVSILPAILFPAIAHVAPPSAARIAAAEALLHAPESRMVGLKQLIEMAGFHMYEGSMFLCSGSKERDELERQAARATGRAQGPADAVAALEFPDRGVKLWGIFGFYPPPGCDADERAEWVLRLSALERLACSDDGLRWDAVERLWSFPEAHEFLKERIGVEQSPDVLMRLAYRSPADTEQFCALLLKLLNHSDVLVRNKALLFIGWNHNSAPMFQVRFNTVIFDRVLELTKSQPDRTGAASALDGLSRLEPERCLPALLELAHDPSPSVRWQVALAFKPYLDRPLVSAAITELLEDADPMVQYMAILASGAEKHTDKLRVLSQSGDERVAQWASAWIKLIEAKAAKKP